MAGVLTLMTAGALAGELMSAHARCEELLTDQGIAVFRVQDFLQSYLPYLQRQLDVARPFYPDNVLHVDSFACRFCSTSSSLMWHDLVWQMPYHQWQVRRTQYAYQGYYHDYIYSPDLNLMIDPTYRQFIVQMGPMDFDSLPRVFVGTPEQFRRLMRFRMPPDVLENYLNATNWIRPEVFYRESGYTPPMSH